MSSCLIVIDTTKANEAERGCRVEVIYFLILVVWKTGSFMMTFEESDGDSHMDF